MAAALISSCSTLNLIHPSLNSIAACSTSSATLKPPPPSRVHYQLSNRRRSSSRSKLFSKPYSPPVMQWQDCTVKKEIDIPVSVAYDCYSDREAIAKWMPFISSVQPTPNQKIHWRSLDGLPNRGAVRFFPKGDTSCIVELTVSYEVPPILVPVASALQPFLENLLRSGLERFATFAKTY
ncbi:hypothetical protein LINPERPRIM_LOCUS12254 [Linum perenne]